MNFIVKGMNSYVLTRAETAELAGIKFRSLMSFDPEEFTEVPLLSEIQGVVELNPHGIWSYYQEDPEFDRAYYFIGSRQECDNFMYENRY